MKFDATSFKKTVMQNAEARLLPICVAAVAEAQTNMKRLPGGAHSAPEGWPAIQTGWLEQSITYEIIHSGDKVEGRFGIIPSRSGGEALGYAYWLEIGTSDMKPRPWLTLTMDAMERMFGLKFERHL